MARGHVGGDPSREAALHTATIELRDAERLQQVLDALGAARRALLPNAAGTHNGDTREDVGAHQDGGGAAVQASNDDDGDTLDGGFPSRKYGAFVDELFRTTVPRWGGALVAGHRKRLLDDLVTEVSECKDGRHTHDTHDTLSHALDQHHGSIDSLDTSAVGKNSMFRMYSFVGRSSIGSTLPTAQSHARYCSKLKPHVCSAFFQPRRSCDCALVCMPLTPLHVPLFCAAVTAPLARSGSGHARAVRRSVGIAHSCSALACKGRAAEASRGAGPRRCSWSSVWLSRRG
jgi:hypothetical protein